VSLFPDEDVLTKEIETWKGFIDCYRYSVAINNHAQASVSTRIFNHVIVINTA
jgi:hypothetical protein